MTDAKRIALNAAQAVVAVLASAITWMVVTGLAGMGAIVIGVHHLAGPGWSYVAAGVSLVAVSAFIRKGLANV